MSFTRTATALLAITTARAVLLGQHDSMSPSPANELILAEQGDRTAFTYGDIEMHLQKKVKDDLGYVRDEPGYELDELLEECNDLVETWNENKDKKTEK